MVWRSRLLIVMSAVVVLAMAVMYLVSADLIQGEFFKIENRQVQQDSARALDAMGNEENELEVKATDWSNWDDNYKFVIDHNQAFITSNLADGSLANLDINFMLFYNTNGQLVQGKGIDTDGNDIDVPQQLLDQFKPGSSLFATGDSSVSKGIVSLPAAPLLLVTLPILKSDATGPLHGTLVFAVYLGADQVKQLANLTHLNLSIYSLNGPSLPADVASVQHGLPTSSASVVRLDQNHIAGYRLVNDIYGDPLLISKVESNRDAYNEAIHAFYIYLAVIAGVLMLLVLITAYFSRQLVLRDRTIQLKDQFFSIASDELRTPLFDIRGKSMQLSDQYASIKTDDKFQELTHEISESSVRLIRLVSNFLDAVRLERAKMNLSAEEFAIKEASDAVREELGGLAAQKQLTITAQVSDTLPHVRADKERVKQVLYNLVGNAVAKTGQGGVTVSAAADGQLMRVYVSDTSPGLKPAEQKALARQLAASRPGGSVGGSNLSLFISKALVELMGGQMRLEEPSDGKGMSISFTLPLANTASPVVTAPVPVAPDSPTSTEAAPADSAPSGPVEFQFGAPPVQPIPPPVEPLIGEVKPSGEAPKPSGDAAKPSSEPPKPADEPAKPDASGPAQPGAGS